MKTKDAIRVTAMGATALLAVGYSLTSTARANGNYCALNTCTNGNDGSEGLCDQNADLPGVTYDPNNPYTYDCACFTDSGAIPWDSLECVS
jgi:hypothetical protein